MPERSEEDRDSRESLSIVVPVYNEAENIQRLYDALNAVVPELNQPFEYILVDDGSTDGSTELLASLAEKDYAVKVISFRSNFGQTAAMNAGIQAASGDIIILLDADLQNDSADIPMMLDKLDEGFDLVHGWRKNRQDAFLHRLLPSKIANALIAFVTGFPVNDLGCTLKVIRREIAQELQLYGEMHRFIPILAHWRGARCVEVVTRHHARQFGQSKYGLSRIYRVILDLITVKYLIQYLISPMKLFGAIGLACGAVGFLAGLGTVWMKLGYQIDMTGNPLLLLTAFSTMAAIQFLILGMLGELGARIYYELQRKQPYAIRSTTNFESPDAIPMIKNSRRPAA